MLECIAIVVDVMVVIVRIRKEVIALCEDVPATDVGTGQKGIFWLQHLEHFFFLVVQIPTNLIPQNWYWYSDRPLL